MVKFVLASASPRRLSLLEQIGVVPDVVEPPRITERYDRQGEMPRQLAARLAREKTESVYNHYPDAIVMGADTLVSCGRRILMKPRDEGQARDFLYLLSGRRHRVHTGLCAIGSGLVVRQRLVTTVVQFKRLSDREIEFYIDSGEWSDKAGAYAIQGRAGMFIRSLNGSYSNVVGLPLYEAYTLLTSFNYQFSAATLKNFRKI